ncbi:MAG: ferritin-like domain-containing protein [Acidobacteriota bacterium]
MYNFNAAEVFKIAIEIEENGKKFYEQSLKVISDAGVKALFQDLASQEIDHKKRFESMKAQVPASASGSTVWDPDNELDKYIKAMSEQHVFIKNTNMDALIAEVKDMKSALHLAISFEKDSVIFFLSLEDATEGQAGKEAIRALVKEEQEHLKRLTLELKRIS